MMVTTHTLRPQHTRNDTYTRFTPPPTYLFILLFSLGPAMCLAHTPLHTRHFNILPFTINNAPNLLSDLSVELLRRISIDTVLILSSFRFYESNFFTLHYTCNNIEYTLYSNPSSYLPSPINHRCSLLLVYPHHTSCSWHSHLKNVFKPLLHYNEWHWFVVNRYNW